jgi:hypothetical protein
MQTRCLPSGRAVWGMDLDLLESEMVCLNTIQGMDIHPRLYVL